jgi:hypothetical protein
MKCIEIEEAVARLFGIRQHIIVPNASWGLGLHECDLLIVRPSGYAIEVEIKTSKADLKQDAKKSHGHYSEKIKQLYFAVPKDLYDAACEYAPFDAGIITVAASDPEWRLGKLFAHIERESPIRKNARPLNEKEILKAATLGAMRVWSLKRKLIAKMSKAA